MYSLIKDLFSDNKEPKAFGQNKFPGYKFITNFNADDAKFFHKAAIQSGLDYLVSTKGVDVWGNEIEDTKGFFVVEHDFDKMQKFWKAFDKFKK
jgi:hypothetical protein